MEKNVQSSNAGKTLQVREEKVEKTQQENQTKGNFQSENWKVKSE